MNDENRNQPEGEEVRDDMAAAGAADAPAAGRGEPEPTVESEAGEPAEADAATAAETADATETETESAETDEEIDPSDLPTISEDDLRDLINEAMQPAAEAEAENAEAEEAEAEGEAAPTESEHLEDLRRVTAEYANYRRRTEREKAELKDHATASVVKKLLPVLDDLGRAKQAGDLEEGTAMRVIADKLLNSIERLGVEAYGAAGDAFDPLIHEAIAQLPNPEVEAETIADVVELGYRIGEIELRPAKVAVFVPTT